MKLLEKVAEVARPTGKTSLQLESLESHWRIMRMSTISIRWYYEDDVEKWETYERRGTLGPTQKHLLESWRVLKQKYPGMKSMEVMRGQCMVGAVDHSKVVDHD